MSTSISILHEIATLGTTFKDNNALLTGVGKGSISIEIVKGLLAGGARVVIIDKSSQGFAPIHEIANDRNTRIKAFYWKLWYGDNEVLPSIGIRDKFVGPEVTIKAEDVEQFCAVVGNQGESFKAARNEKIQAPMDFAIVTGWQVCRFFIFVSFHNIDVML